MKRIFFTFCLLLYISGNCVFAQSNRNKETDKLIERLKSKKSAIKKQENNSATKQQKNKSVTNNMGQTAWERAEQQKKVIGTTKDGYKIVEVDSEPPVDFNKVDMTKYVKDGSKVANRNKKEVYVSKKRINQNALEKTISEQVEKQSKARKEQKNETKGKEIRPTNKNTNTDSQHEMKQPQVPDNKKSSKK